MIDIDHPTSPPFRVIIVWEILIVLIALMWLEEYTYGAPA